MTAKTPHTPLTDEVEYPLHHTSTEALKAFLINTKQQSGQPDAAQISYSFLIEVTNSVEYDDGQLQARRFVQSLRTNLSRWRNNLEALRGNTSPDDWQAQFPMFAMNLDSIKTNEDLALITLTRQYTALPKLIMKNGVDLTDVFGVRS